MFFRVQGNIGCVSAALVPLPRAHRCASQKLPTTAPLISTAAKRPPCGSTELTTMPLRETAGGRALSRSAIRQICDGHHRQRLNTCYAWNVT